MKGVKNDKAILVVDVTDRYENRDYFHKATKEKVDKYIPCLNHLIVNHLNYAVHRIAVAIKYYFTLPFDSR